MTARPHAPDATPERHAAAGDALFADTRHFRGDARLFRTALRRGWLQRTPGQRLASLAERMAETHAERTGRGFTTANAAGRHGLGFAMTIVAIEELNAKAAGETLDDLSPTPVRPPGRPRMRPRRADAGAILDAALIAAQARDEGRDLDALVVVVRDADRPDDPGVKIAVELVPMPRGARRAFFRCPRCLIRRAHLFPDAKGVGCRTCGVVDYARGRQSPNNG
ncbi:MAG TPA: hypothetical protein PKC43_02080 [Phycisphaerales bacterium]|nr:hypothetical protein [Phycisphaerales bacterium]HMP36214.1 hypothetical protein [Phycisphaerales bacterium]